MQAVIEIGSTKSKSKGSMASARNADVSGAPRFALRGKTVLICEGGQPASAELLKQVLAVFAGSGARVCVASQNFRRADVEKFDVDLSGVVFYQPSGNSSTQLRRNSGLLRFAGGLFAGGSLEGAYQEDPRAIDYIVHVMSLNFDLKDAKRTYDASRNT